MGLMVLAGTGLSRKIISERQARLIAELQSNVADSPAFLAERLFALQLDRIILFVPGMSKPVSLPAGRCSFDPKTFPDSFLNGLVYEVEHGSPVYHLKLREVRATRQIEVLNADGKVFYVFNPQPDYDPLWIARRLHPKDFLPNCAPANLAFTEEWMDPSHVEMEVTLIPADYIEVYAENAVASLLDVLLADASVSATSPTVARASLSGGTMTMMRSTLADSNILVEKPVKTPSGAILVVEYPDDFTNRLELFVSTNMMDFGWSLLATNLSTAGTNTLTWLDPGATNSDFTNRFYAAGNADIDSDGDGIVDGREVLMYRTDPNSIDSDGDGLVDGYSGVVTTNSYPGGVATNGNLYVEGELTWHTNPKVKDTDGDGMSDGWEVAHGHNPLDPNDPPNVSGTVFYSGRQTGTVWVIAVTSSNSWSTAHSYTSAAAGFPVSYMIPDLEQTNYWIKSWVDSISNGQTNATEAQGVYTNVQLVITNRVTGKDIMLVDPDTDSDGLPDWWEIAYFGSITNTTGGADKDGDEYSNLDEYNANTDPTNNLSHPWNISGTVTYTGPQTGVIHVVACTNGTDWAWVYADTLTNAGTYSITHLPPNTNYWIRAWRDSNGDGLPTFWEACGSHSGNPVFLDANLTGKDIALSNPDNDGDGLPDWWEVLYGLDPTRGGGNGLAAWWKFDEGAGTNVLDATANTNNGVLKNGSSAWVTGIISNGLSLNGTNAYVEVPDSTGLKPGTVSIGLWIQPSRLYTNGTAMFLSKRVPGGSAGYSLGYETGALAFTVYASGVKSVQYPCALTADAPIHVTGTFGSSSHSLFINGARVATTNYDWGMEMGTISQNTNVLRLGAASGANPTNFFAGLLDDVRVYPGEWSTNEVKAIWEIGADSDGDGLNNWKEYQLGTNPNNSDTDGDGLSDYAEVFTYATSPVKRDTDKDGMDDDEELLAGTNPTVPNGGAATTAVRYYYDPDDRLTGAYGGADGGGGSGTYMSTSAGNITTTAERRAQ